MEIRRSLPVMHKFLAIHSMSNYRVILLVIALMRANTQKLGCLFEPSCKCFPNAGVHCGVSFPLGLLSRSTHALELRRLDLDLFDPGEGLPLAMGILEEFNGILLDVLSSLFSITLLDLLQYFFSVPSVLLQYHFGTTLGLLRASTMLFCTPLVEP